MSWRNKHVGTEKYKEVEKNESTGMNGTYAGDRAGSLLTCRFTERAGELPTLSGEAGDRPGASKRGVQGTQERLLSLHSVSRGLNHGIHTGIGFKERQGAGNSIALEVPGRQTDTFPKLTHGRI
jgi:hypothetical protein